MYVLFEALDLGFTTVYDGFSFSTVRNAGHMVPVGDVFLSLQVVALMLDFQFYQPARAFQLLSSFLAGNKK